MTLTPFLETKSKQERRDWFKARRALIQEYSENSSASIVRLLEQQGLVDPTGSQNGEQWRGEQRARINAVLQQLRKKGKVNYRPVTRRTITDALSVIREKLSIITKLEAQELKDLAASVNL